MPGRAIRCRATRRLATAAEALDCTILDHLVFGGGDCTSLRADRASFRPPQGLICSGAGRGRASRNAIEIGLASGQHAEFHRLHAQRGELAFELRRRNAVMPHRAVGIDDDDQAVRLHAIAQVPQERVGRLHLVIHVDEEHAVEGCGGSIGLSGVPSFDRDIVEALALDPVAQLIAHVGTMSSASTRPFGTDDRARRTV